MINEKPSSGKKMFSRVMGAKAVHLESIWVSLATDIILQNEGNWNNFSVFLLLSISR
jgi:hypothetical protein